MLVVIKKFVATSNRFFFHDLLIIFVGDKRITIINVVHFVKERRLVPLSLRVFN